jgi:hypothetical protein
MSSRIRATTIASLSAVALAAMGASALSYSPISAQARAEHTCQTHGVRPNSAAWELCLSHVTRAYEWGEFSLAGQLAHAAGQADDSCLERGLQSNSAAYKSCLDREIDAQNDLLVLGDGRTDVNVAGSPGELVQQ